MSSFAKPHLAVAIDRSALAVTALAFVIWGLLPLYLRQLHAVPLLQVMAHRIVWCLVITLGFLAARGQLSLVRATLADRGRLLRLLASALLISVNWFAYLLAVTQGQVMQASLGYFINPLVSVLLGVFVLSERLNVRQWIAVGIAALGVLWLTVQVGHLPWIALTLAVSFALYGLVRKQVQVEPVVGLAVETLLLFPAALGWLIFEALRGAGAFTQQGPLTMFLLIVSGLVTAVPLTLFAYGVRRIPLSTVGLLQYIAPSLQLLVAVLLFGEPFTHVQKIGFGLIWAALLLYMADGLLRRPPAVVAIEA